MKRLVLFTLVLIITLSIPASASASSGRYPYINIVSVVADQTVTISAHNFPAHDTFRVTMGYYGSCGIGGVVVGFTDTGSGGSFTATYNIPSTLAGQQRIAIRLQSPTSGYYAYNWFFNNSTGSSATPTPTPTPSTPGYSGYPYFFITAVVRDQTVTINAHNFPPDDTFTVMMGAYGTYGIGGTVVGTTSTGSGGAFSATYTIPANLAGSYRIAIRLSSPTSGYYAYNWFYNNTTP
jgi:hypothetical protein